MVDTAFTAPYSGGEEHDQKKKRREKCKGCERPVNVCLCTLLPSKSGGGGLLQTHTHILILQHPHELKHKLATVPILQKCLLNCHVIVGRCLKRSCSPILNNMTSQCHVLLLYPGETAVDLDTWTAMSSYLSTSATGGTEAISTSDTQKRDEMWVSLDFDNWTSTSSSQRMEKVFASSVIQSQDKNWVALDLDRRASTSETMSSSSGMEMISFDTQNQERKWVLLIVIDGTWHHAREMVRASMPFLREVGAHQVCLPYDTNAEGNNMWSCEQRLTLRKEPFGGCLSTMEAIARALRILEPAPHGAHVEQKLLAVLGAMVAFQLHNLKPMRPRPKVLKKGQCHET